jgi:hypothetical protein
MKTLFAMMAVAVLAIPTMANDGCTSCGGSQAVGPKTWGPRSHKTERFTGWFHSTGGSMGKPQLAPWYQYFPYNGQFQTPFPVGGNPYGGGMVNPYFPAN